jgi:hypothetical protein
MELWTAYLIGLAGSLHCIGMCGPIAIAISPHEGSRFRQILGLVLYNLGRSVTYGVIGVAAGLLGRTVHVAGYQQGLSIAMGVLLLLAILLPSRFGALITGTKIHARLTMLLTRAWNRLMGKNSPRSLLAIGLLNGFLPCGLVYVALAGAITTGGGLAGGMFMVTFGLGTIPVMLAVSLAGRLMGAGFRSKLRRLIPVAGAMLAVLFILRGMSLGIPYVSPKEQTSPDGQSTMNCCPQSRNAPANHFPDSSGR